jgi:hypothetical protein
MLPTITAILILATLVESLVEYLIRPIVKPQAPTPEPAAVTWRDMALRYVAALVGVALCILYNADLLALVGLVSPWPWIGSVITGIIIGRGANFVHDFSSRWLAPGR